MTPAPPDTAPPRPDPVARAAVVVVGWVTRHPWPVLVGCLALAAAAVFAAVTRLEYHTQRNDLLSAEKDCQKRWQKYLDAFGDDDDMVVVAEGTDRDRMKAALDAVADRVRAKSDQFDRVFHRVDLRALHDRAVLFLSADELDGVKARLDRMGPLFGPLSPLAWRLLSLQALLGEAGGALAAGREPTAADRDLLAQLPAVAHAAAAAVRDPAAYRNPWAVAGPPTAGREAEKQLTEPQYFFTPDGTLATLLCRPKKAAASFTPAKEASDTLRGILAEVRADFPGVALGLTGLPVLETDEMVMSDVDSQRASWLALAGVAVLYVVVYRGLRYPALTLSTLVVGTVWALGWAAVTVGHLNILSATFAVMLIGLGDYGVLWVARYDEARAAGKSPDDATRHTAEHAGSGILTAAVTTSLAFFATTLADFRAVAELGWIAGSGVLLCAAACFTLMPALMTVLGRRRAAPARPAERAEYAATIPFPARRADAWLPALSSRPRLVLAVGAAAVLAVCGFAGRLHYDHNLLNMQARGLDSVAWEHKLIDRSAGSTWDALGLAATRDDALALKAKYEALPGVGRVVEVASLLPADQPAKLPLVKSIHDRLASLPPLADLPEPVGSSPAAVLDLTTRVGQLGWADAALARAMADLKAALEAAPPGVAAARLKAFDRRLTADLAADLHRLRAVSRPAPIAVADLPEPLRERYVGAGGEFLVRAFARDSLWEYDALGRFTTAAAGVDPDATGKAFRTLEGLRQMKSGFERAGLYALLAIVAVLAFDFRCARSLGLALFPLAVGVGLTLGVMGLFGVPLNPANLIALPLIVGVGVDNGVHVLHDYRGRPPGRPYRLGAATGRGVTVAGLTTVLGFGTLMTARHEGMKGLGLALTLGVTFSMAAALVLLPAVLRLLDLASLGERVLPLARGKRRRAA